MEVLKIFKKITKIPHCSGNTGKLKDFIIEYAKNEGFNVETDKAGNVLAYLEKPVICLQSHIDMVCVGNAPEIEIESDGEWLWAKNSSLGADNGIGVAIMLNLMKKYKNVEYLFTNDEEIGLIGAFNLELKINSPYLLNLDSEDENIYIGCAGGVDAIINYPLKKIKKRGYLADVKIDNLPGGHSGVDIHKNIPNAISELAFDVEEVVEFRGGERRNSIPRSAKAKEFFESGFGEEVDVFDDGYIRFLRNLPHGVLEYDFKFNVVSKSINLAIVENEKIILSLRANSNELLEEVKEYLKAKAKIEVEFEGEYPAWRPEITNLAKILQEITHYDFKVIHAGLECAVLKNKFPKVSMASIGPVIENPHSIYEKVNVKSIEKTLNSVETLLQKVTKR
ncbi:dipeptidase D [Lebetimonas natsushimae]|uniref:Dipeptidase D n=1 Tax=Lebetimonas natsushimae TaxID=1936991 RepID=A0A292YCP3_9BACT|nr:M20/M25/M40 family metallo-hydrolase [Lebetimonas natsushimae]GAX87239.1 dipeptidase D [Lebetimonas natsushimae]